MNRREDSVSVESNVASLWGEVTIPELGQYERQLPELVLIFERRAQGWTIQIDQNLALTERTQIAGYRPFVGRWPGQLQRRAGGGYGHEDEIYEFASTHPPESLQLHPALCDRPIVAQTGSPLVVLPGHSARLYMLSPIWAQVYQVVAGSKPHHLLLEVPLYQSDDAWFGSNTLDGELCYAAQHLLSCDPQALGQNEFLAISPVRITNAGTETLVIERLMIPVPSLNLYKNRAGVFWTQEVIYRFDDSEDKGRLEIVSGAPTVAGTLQIVTQARTPAKRLVIGQALRLLFG